MKLKISDFFFWLFSHWDYQKSCDTAWDNLPQEEKDRTIKYITLLYRWSKDNSSVSKQHMKWILENCDAPTHLLPMSIIRKYDFSRFKTGYESKY